MSVEEVKEYLKKWNWEGRVRELAESCATVDLAAAALGVESGRIAKSITFADPTAESDATPGVARDAARGAANASKPAPRGCILIVTSGDCKIDNAKFREQLGFKATMLKHEDALVLTGHAVGGVCPFAITSGLVKIYLDVSLRRFDLVYPAAGSSNALASFSCDELFMCSGATSWVDVCRER